MLEYFPEKIHFFSDNAQVNHWRVLNICRHGTEVAGVAQERRRDGFVATETSMAVNEESTWPIKKHQNRHIKALALISHVQILSL